MSRRASRPAGPVTPGTDQLVGSWRAPAAPDSAADGAGSDAPPPTDTRIRTGGTARPTRRVTTAAARGSDPAPVPEPARHREGENDDRLLGDKPPHWG